MLFCLARSRDEPVELLFLSTGRRVRIQLGFDIERSALLLGKPAIVGLEPSPLARKFEFLAAAGVAATGQRHYRLLRGCGEWGRTGAIFGIPQTQDHDLH
jgi:hypothetical protein